MSVEGSKGTGANDLGSQHAEAGFQIDKEEATKEQRKTGINYCFIYNFFEHLLLNTWFIDTRSCCWRSFMYDSGVGIFLVLV